MLTRVPVAGSALLWKSGTDPRGRSLVGCSRNRIRRVRVGYCKCTVLLPTQDLLIHNISRVPAVCPKNLDTLSSAGAGEGDV